MMRMVSSIWWLLLDRFLSLEMNLRYAPADCFELKLEDHKREYSIIQRSPMRLGLLVFFA